ncbi:MAG TPA: alpha/beta fold hydrolase [Candidatus Dormibacteraeota bacterium]|nr:alpha/beta fold hydrolase [Candidatus Dormibacteraeota bacterium]
MQIDFAPDRALYPFQSRWFDGAGPRIHYVDEGKGRAVVMFHGNPTWSFLYRKVIDELKDDFRCIAMDYPGFGLSERPSGYGYTSAEHADVIGKLVDHLGLDAFIVVGQDWGGPIGMTVALERAKRVAGMVFANTWYWPAQGSLNTFSLVMSSPPLQWLILQRNSFVNFIMPRSVSTPMKPEVFKAYQDAQPTPEARRGVAEFPKQIRRARPMLERLAAEAPKALGDKPVELVWAMKDPAFGHPAVLARWQRDFPNANVTRVPDANHYIQEDAPEALAAAIKRVHDRIRAG